MSAQNVKDQAIEVVTIDGLECWLVPGHCGGINGYAYFLKRPTIEQGYDGILTYVPVHGGITYATEREGGVVYGFDTAHCDSGEFPLHDPGWIKEQIAIMINGIKRAAEVERKYLRCTTNRGKGKHCDYVGEACPEQRNNFGVNINLLSGKL